MLLEIILFLIGSLLTIVLDYIYISWVMNCKYTKDDLDSVKNLAAFSYLGAFIVLICILMDLRIK